MTICYDFKSFDVKKKALTRVSSMFFSMLNFIKFTFHIADLNAVC